MKFPKELKILRQAKTIEILLELHKSGQTFSELRRKINPRTLSKRLDQLVEIQWVKRVPLDTRPLKAEFRLTEKGRIICEHTIEFISKIESEQYR